MFNSDTHIPHIVKTIFGRYIVHDPKYHDLRARGQWTKEIFFCLFHSFKWSSTYLCYIPYEIQKSLKSAHPITHELLTCIKFV
jgi:hypothetical protein